MLAGALGAQTLEAQTPDAAAAETEQPSGALTLEASLAEAGTFVLAFSVQRQACQAAVDWPGSRVEEPLALLEDAGAAGWVARQPPSVGPAGFGLEVPSGMVACWFRRGERRLGLRLTPWHERPLLISERARVCV